jgi:hypothetical protein
LAADADAPHRGRFQAQGGKGRGLQESESWAQGDPLTAVEGHALLGKLHDKLSVADQQLRQSGFDQAHAYINSALAVGGVGPIKKTFPRGKLRKVDGRVDLEVIKGLAFVREPP